MPQPSEAERNGAVHAIREMHEDLEQYVGDLGPDGFTVTDDLCDSYARELLQELLGTLSTTTGLIEPVGGLLGAGLVVSSPMWLPLGLGMAAGAMLYAVSHEVIPESHRDGHESSATSGLLFGFVVMMALDIGLG